MLGPRATSPCALFHPFHALPIGMHPISPAQDPHIFDSSMTERGLKGAPSCRQDFISRALRHIINTFYAHCPRLIGKKKTIRNDFWPENTRRTLVTSFVSQCTCTLFPERMSNIVRTHWHRNTANSRPYPGQSSTHQTSDKGGRIYFKARRSSTIVLLASTVSSEQ